MKQIKFNRIIYCSLFKAIKLTLLEEEEEEEEEEDAFVDVPLFVLEFTAASNFDSKFMSIYKNFFFRVLEKNFNFR